MSLSGVVPSTGSTFGTRGVELSGSGFNTSTTVRVDGTVVPVVSLVASIVIRVNMPPHATGPVDIEVSDATGRSAKLAGAFRYVVVPPPVITSITPSIGSTGGDTSLAITGTGFVDNWTVTVAGAEAPPGEWDGSTTIWVTTIPHQAGSVDVVVTNPDGQRAVAAGGFTFVPPDSLDFNGEWSGWAYPLFGPGDRMSFTIANNVLVRVSCATQSNFPVPSPPAIAAGTFSSSAGVKITGKITSPTDAIGTIDTPPCSGRTWYATKR